MSMTKLQGTILQMQVKALKKSLPKYCTFLSPYADKSGEIYLKAVVNKKSIYLTIPQDFRFTEADIARITNLIETKCHVTEGNESHL